MTKKITVPDPRLKKRSVEIEDLDSSVEKLIVDLRATLHKQSNPEGVGISAPQIGVNKRVFIIKTGFTKDGDLSKLKETVFINPEIIESSVDTNFDHLTPEDRYFEGCLSIPGLYGEVKRPWTIKIKYQGFSPVNLSICQFVNSLSGFDAIYFQHEFDHLNGILFTERVAEQGGKLFRLGKDGNFEPL